MAKRDYAAIGRLGGIKTAQTHGTDHMRRIGKNGFHAMVRKHYKGDYRLAINTLIARGLIAQDPNPNNGAWSKDRIPDRLPDNYQPPTEERNNPS